MSDCILIRRLMKRFPKFSQKEIKDDKVNADYFRGWNACQLEIVRFLRETLSK